MSRWPHWFLWGVLFGCSFMGTAVAACDPAKYAQELELTGLGTVYVGDLRFDSVRDEAELYNGVCFTAEAEPGLTLTAPQMRVTRVQTAPAFTALGANLTLGRYTLFAAELSGDASGFSLENLSLSSPQFSGSVVRARYDTVSAQTILTGVRLKLGNFRVESVSAGLTQRTLVLQSARATTCTCESGGLYALLSPNVTINLGNGVVRVEGGVLETFGLQLALSSNLRLLLDAVPQTGRPSGRGGGGVRVASVPVFGSGPAPAPVGTIIDEGTKLALPLQLFPWALLEFGLAGLDDDHEPGLVSLLRLGAKLGQTDFRAALGRAGPGWRGDALIRQPLSPHVGLDLSTSNRLWDKAGYLHDGTFSLYAARTVTQVAGEVADSLELGGQVFAGLSQQTLASLPVRSLRTGLEARANYTAPPTPAGMFSLLGETDFTYYPNARLGPDATPAALTQFAVRALPSWRAQVGPLKTALSYDARWVLGGSPFSVEFDRLEPRSTVNASATLKTGDVSLGASGRYAFILNSGSNPVRQLKLDASRIVWFGKIKNSNLVSAEFAGLLGPPDPDTDAFVSAESTFDLGALGYGLELGFKTRYDLLPAERGLKLLELSSSFPIELPSLTLRPFLGFNAAPLLTGEPLPTLTGYGLEVAYRSCCGTLIASYRFHDQTAVTRFDLQLAPDPAAAR